MSVQIVVASGWSVSGEIVSWDNRREHGVALINDVERDIFQSYDGDGYLVLNDRDTVLYQRALEMLPVLEKEVLAIVARCSDGSDVWTIHHGVGAWEVLHGYCQNTELLSWFATLPMDVLYEMYQRFIDCWSSAHPQPVRKTEKTLHDLLVVKNVQQRPTVVCLCGSTRFGGAFQDALLFETLAGKIVLSIGCNTKNDALFDNFLKATGRVVIDKEALDILHLFKIDMADEVLVLNVGGYVGESTRREVEYATLQGKIIRWLEQ